MADEYLNIDLGTLSGYPNSHPPSPTSVVPSYTNTLTLDIQDTDFEGAKFSITPPSDTNPNNNANYEIGAILVVRHSPASASENNSEDNAGYLVKVISYSGTSCEVEIVATGKHKVVPTEMLFPLSEIRIEERGFSGSTVRKRNILLSFKSAAV